VLWNHFLHPIRNFSFFSISMFSDGIRLDSAIRYVRLEMRCA
jgi:hypothetical protein